MNRPKFSLQNQLGKIIFLLPWIPIIFLFQKYTLNLPFKDDYRVIASFLRHYLAAPDFITKLQSILIPDNESYPVIMRLILLFQYHFDGVLNFQHILYFCWIFILVIWIVLQNSFNNTSRLFGVIIGLWFLNPMNHEMFFRTDVATYQMVTLSLSIFILYVASDFRKMPAWIKFLFYCAYFFVPGGSINGMIANVLVVLIFIRNKQKTALTFTAILLFLQLLLLYFLKDNGKSVGLIENLIKYNWRLPVAYFMSVGSILHLGYNLFFKVIASLSGLTVMIYLLYQYFIIDFKEINFEKVLFLFTGLSLAAIVVMRYNYWTPGFDSVLESRYKIYGCVIFVLGLNQFLKQHPEKLARQSIMVLSLAAFSSGFYKSIFYLKDQGLIQVTEAYNVAEGTIDPKFAQLYLLNNEGVKFLKEKGAFDFFEHREKIDQQMASGELISARENILENLKTDPLNEGDWSKMDVPLKKLELRGDFPRKEFYIIRFKLKSGKYALNYLIHPPRTIFQQLTGKPKTYNLLSHEYYYDVFEGLEIKNSEIIGIDNLK